MWRVSFPMLALTVPMAQSLLHDDDELRLRHLFANGYCSRGVYLDVGTNVGVQIRKLYEPQKYAGAGVLTTFDSVLGPAPRCGVCSIGFEPNPRHGQRLNEVERRLNAAGVGVVIFRAAAGAVDGEVVLEMGASKSNFEDAGASALGIGRYRGRASTTVRSIRLSRILSVLGKLLREQRSQQGGRRQPVLMKLDIEGSEWTVLPDLLVTKTICTAERVYIE